MCYVNYSNFRPIDFSNYIKQCHKDTQREKLQTVAMDNRYILESYKALQKPTVFEQLRRNYKGRD